MVKLSVAGFYFVSYDKALYSDIFDEIVPMDRIRLVSDLEGPLLDEIERDEQPIPPQLKGWAANFNRVPVADQEDFLNKIESLVDKSKAFSCSFNERRDKMVIVGHRSSHRLARKLLEVAFMNLVKAKADGSLDFGEPEFKGKIAIDSELAFVFTEHNS